MTPDIAEIHIEPTNICTLKCPDCERTRFLDQWPQHWKNHSIDTAALLNFLNIDLSKISIRLCGNTGDPIYHPEFHKLITELKNRGSKLTIITNGSYKSADWWQQTVSILDSSDTVIFSVDGLPDNFTQYRVNGHWESIHTAMVTSVASSVKTVWKYIPFSYNENNIEAVKKFSDSIGIDRFWIDFSDRFDSKTEYLRPTDINLSNRYQAQQQWKQNTSASTLMPKCQNNDQHYISANGYYSPCCYIADHRFYYKTDFGKNKKTYQIANQTLTQILTQPVVVEFYKDLTNQPVCQYNCPATQGTYEKEINTS